MAKGKGTKGKVKSKSHSGAKDRFRRTGSGKIVRQKAGIRHLMEHKQRRRVLDKEGRVTVSPADAGRIKRMLDS